MDEFPDLSEARSARRLRDRSRTLARRLSALTLAGPLATAKAPVRPIVLIQSDDWGRVGAPSLEALDRLRSAGHPVGRSAWDEYGLETEEDVLELGRLLASVSDADGRPACMTANFIVANADLQRMRAEGFQGFRYVALQDGFPEPWRRPNLLSAYRSNIDRQVFYPGLHGFTHFNVGLFLKTLRNDSPAGARARALVANDIPYLASLTPEFNFALVNRERAETFLAADEQAAWIDQGIELFRSTFGSPPRTVCAPGYRANADTFRIWASRGVEAVQANGEGLLSRQDGMLHIQRNVSFEPTLHDGDPVAPALKQAVRAVRNGFPIVICSHSLNFITPHIGKAAQSRESLRRLLEQLLELFPDLRFASDGELLGSLAKNDTAWWRKPTMNEIAHRFLSRARRS